MVEEPAIEPAIPAADRAVEEHLGQQETEPHQQGRHEDIAGDPNRRTRDQRASRSRPAGQMRRQAVGWLSKSVVPSITGCFPPNATGETCDEDHRRRFVVVVVLVALVACACAGVGAFLAVRHWPQADPR